MYLPKKLYNAAPHYWLFLGLLFVSMGVYVGFEQTMGFVFIGAACCAWAIRVSVARQPDPVKTCEETALE